jgi:thiol-disulfide isomerase/thioredoxin
MSSGIYFFNNNDFTIRQNTKGKLMCFTEEYKGLYLVLFYSKECKYCDELMSEFKQLPTMILGCKFVMVNINHNPEIIQKSKQSISPITYVPDLILYVNGLPYIRYDGPNKLENIKDFVMDIANKLEKTSFMSDEISNVPTKFEQPVEQQPQQQHIQYPENAIPEYTIGKPLCGSNKDIYGKCYLGFDSAYITS